MATVEQAGGAERSAGSASRRNRLRWAVVALSIVVAVGGVAILLTRGGGKHATTNSVVATLRVPGSPNAIVAGSDALWAGLNAADGTPGAALVRLNLATGAVERTVKVGGVLGGFAIRVGGGVWVARSADGTDTKPGTVVELDWLTGAIRRRVAFAHPVFGMVYGAGSVWAVVGLAPATLVRIDPSQGKVVGKPVRIDANRVIGLAFGAGALWATGFEDGVLIRIDPAGGRLRMVPVGSEPVGLVVAHGGVWVALRASDSVVRVDATTMRVGKPIHVGGLPTWAASVAGSIWVANQAAGTVTRLDAKSGARIGTAIRVAPSSTNGNPPAAHALSVAGNSLWVASMSQQTVSRIDPSR